jgi:hypothetical protein
MTHVQMMSEEILLVVQEAPEEIPTNRRMIGHVEATFVMRNQGTEGESFDVWFPLVNVSHFEQVWGPVENFAAWVNGVPAETSLNEGSGPWDKTVPWATWPVTFPPGQDVVLRNTYDVAPFAGSTYGSFGYVLETGAGWHGPIGEAAITFRLPYKVNESNTVLHHPYHFWHLPHPDAFTISGTDVTWHFSDLEPTQDDNIYLTVLAPSLWEEIIAAQHDVAAMADSPEAHLRLARASVAVLSFRAGLEPIGNSIALAELAEMSYERALELAPKDVEIHVKYCELLWLLWDTDDSLPEDLLPGLERALELAPNNERLLEIKDWVTQAQHRRERPTPTAALTPPPTFTLVSTRTPTSGPTHTPTYVATPTIMPAPPRTSVPALTIPPIIPTSIPKSDGGGNLSIALASSGVLLGILLVALGVILSRGRR